MKPLIVVVMCSMLVSGCTRSGAKVGMGVGLGVVAIGGIVLASEAGEKPDVIVVAELAIVGGLITLISLVAYGAAVANEPDLKKPKVAVPPRASVPRDLDVD